MAALEDNKMLNDIYSEEELPDFRLWAGPRAPRRVTAAPSKVEEPAEHNKPPVSEVPHVSKGLIQQILCELRTFSLQQRQLESLFIDFQ